MRDRFVQRSVVVALGAVAVLAAGCGVGRSSDGDTGSAATTTTVPAATTTSTVASTTTEAPGTTTTDAPTTTEAEVTTTTAEPSGAGPSTPEQLAVAFVQEAQEGGDPGRYAADPSVAAEAIDSLADKAYGGGWRFTIHPTYEAPGNQGFPPGACQLVGDVTVACPVLVERLDAPDDGTDDIFVAYLQPDGATYQVVDFEWIFQG